MKISLLFAFLLGGSVLTFSQVGIGTTTPRGTLDVSGNVLIDGYLRDDININAADDTNTFLLVRSKDSAPVGELKLLDVNLRNVGPVNKYTVKVTQVQRDKVAGLVTNLPESKYVIAITDALFNGANSAITSDSEYGSFSTEVTKVTRSGVVFNAINLDFTGSTTASNANGTWELSLVVYERELVKDWGTFNGSVSDSATPNYSGVSTVTPLGLQ